MSKQWKLSVPALSLAALACMDAYAGCIGSPPFCSAGFNRSGSPAGDIIAARGAFPNSTNNACPFIVTPVDGGEGGGDIDLHQAGGLGILQVGTAPATEVSMTLAGTVRTYRGQNCGLGMGEDRDCNVRIAVDCTDRIIRTKVQGPFEAFAPGFNQVNFNFGPDVANFTFKLAPGVGDEICSAHQAGPYRDWSLRRAFFEACVNGECIRELCTADDGGKPDALRPWHCRPIRTDDCED